jgi:hypothetical protein
MWKYYEYALKDTRKHMVVEKMFQQLSLVENKIKTARNNAKFVNTHNFTEIRKLWELIESSNIRHYYNILKSCSG